MNGLYIHVPFCVKKCGYCDFYSVSDLGLIDGYVKALTHEIRRMSEDEPPENRRVDTIYFGGGTPSLLSRVQVETILHTVRTCYKVTGDAEITLELNPGTVSEQSLKDLKNAGINRLSVGVQSFHDKNLAFLGRIHTAGEAETILEAALAQGFDNVGIDIIHGLPGQSRNDLEADLAKALQFHPAHLSCYMLSYEEGTPLFKTREQGLFSPLSDNRAAGLFKNTMDYLERAGYLHYEISNFARSRETVSRHNLKYWNFKPYRGFGPSAHSFLPEKGKRYWNVRDLGTYIRRISQGLSPEDGHEILTRDQEITESIYLGLRKRSGISIREFNERFERNLLSDFKEVLEPLFKQGLVKLSEDAVFLSRKGILFADHITARLTDQIE